MHHRDGRGAAWSHINDWLDAAPGMAVGTRSPPPGRSRSVPDGNLHGNLVTDAHLAALAIEHGTGICSFDSDFARFKGLHWVNPDRR
ncbi:PIN domain-containing protein [Nesterenkonia ebinurensis]|uniref:hypothetical protein n=1 Tax=Nesterenkonia ebinurensis TaxID=2608252 RepID=UPI001CC480CC|nr:hypothetical protein [Nesterenkonia ebinurensis]